MRAGSQVCDPAPAIGGGVRTDPYAPGRMLGCHWKDRRRRSDGSWSGDLSAFEALEGTLVPRHAWTDFTNFNAGKGGGHTVPSARSGRLDVGRRERKTHTPDTKRPGVRVHEERHREASRPDPPRDVRRTAGATAFPTSRRSAASHPPGPHGSVTLGPLGPREAMVEAHPRPAGHEAEVDGSDHAGDRVGQLDLAPEAAG